MEDQADSRELLQAVLEYSGALVTTAGSAREALRALQSIRPDVIVSDIAMPGEDGFWLIRRLREPEGTRKIPAIAVTVLGARADHLRILEAGFQAHLTKPVDPWELCRVVARLVGRGQ